MLSEKDPKRATLGAELEKLNAAVTDALAKRKAWMDEHMKHFAKLQIGDEIYDLDTGRCLGVVTKHYRYHAERDPRYDTTMRIDYEYRQHPNAPYYDNTSRQSGLRYGTKEDAAQELRYRAESIERGPAFRSIPMPSSDSGLPTWNRIVEP